MWMIQQSVRIFSSTLFSLLLVKNHGKGALVIGQRHLPHHHQSPIHELDYEDTDGIHQFNFFTQNFNHPSEEAGIDLTPFEPTDYMYNELDTKASPLPNCVCGVQPFDDQPHATTWIEGGEETKVNEFPWVAALIYRTEFSNGTILKQHFCAASLINNKFVITAQHCLLKMAVNKTEIWLNEHNILLSTETIGETVKRKAVRFIPHPSYNKLMHYNDIALIELNEEVDITDSRLRPICLPKIDSTDDEHFTTAMTAGWGRIGFTGPKSDKLLKVNLPIISNEDCANRSAAYYKRRVTKNTICAGDLENGRKDSCPGDSGGSLFSRMTTNGRFLILGVCSFGFRCGEIRKPGVYVRLSKYIKWIEHEARTGRKCKS